MNAEALVLSPFDELLVRAALGLDAQAQEAWTTLQEELDVERLDPGQQRLLPALHRTVSAATPTDTVLGRLRGASRRTWSQNQLLLREAANAIESLSHAGIRTCLLKGAGLVALGVHSIGVRPLRDVDVLVPMADVRAAREVLLAAGWQPKIDDRIGSLDHAQALTRDDRGRDLDLHWHVSFALPLRRSRRHPYDDFWARGRAVTIGTTPTETLAPTDHLLHAIVHALQSPESRLMWILDAVALIDTGEIDWDLLGFEAERRGIVLPVRDSLARLHEMGLRPVPASIGSRLRDARVSRRDRFNHRLRTEAEPERMTETQRAFWRWAAANTHNSVPRAVTTFPEFLCRYWSLDSEWRVPGEVLRLAIGRLRRRLRDDEAAGSASPPSP